MTYEDDENDSGHGGFTVYSRGVEPKYTQNVAPRPQAEKPAASKAAQITAQSERGKDTGIA